MEITTINQAPQASKLQHLDSIQFELKKISDYLGETSPKAPINIIDPEEKLHPLACAVETALELIGVEIEAELKEENDRLPDEGIRTGALVGA